MTTTVATEETDDDDHDDESSGDCECLCGDAVLLPLAHLQDEPVDGGGWVPCSLGHFVLAEKGHRNHHHRRRRRRRRRSLLFFSDFPRFAGLTTRQSAA